MVTELGMVSGPVKVWHAWKACFPIVVKELPRVKPVKLQLLNALSPIEVTESGIVSMPVKPESR